MRSLTQGRLRSKTRQTQKRQSKKENINGSRTNHDTYDHARTIEAAKSVIMTVREADNVEVLADQYKECQNRQPSAKAANIQLERRRQIPRTMELRDKCKEHFHG